ncbi:MAG: hypothetical protein AAFN08_15250, partial [Cyanobacteria bacterium J06559_3]
FDTFATVVNGRDASMDTFLSILFMLSPWALTKCAGIILEKSLNPNFESYLGIGRLEYCR